MWLRRFGYVVFVFSLVENALYLSGPYSRLAPAPIRVISRVLLTISLGAILFGILIALGEKQKTRRPIRPAQPIRPAGPPRKQTGVPRRFGVGTLLVIVTMYAVLFTVLQKTDPAFFVLVVVFVTIIGLSQAILFKGHDPRLASMVTGMALGTLLPIVTSVVVLVVAIIHGDVTEGLGAAVFTIFLGVPVGAGFGVVAGYLAGLLIAGVFLLFNKIQPPLEDPDNEEPDEGKPGIPECDSGTQGTADERG
jgi:MFS family permease